MTAPMAQVPTAAPRSRSPDGTQSTFPAGANATVIIEKPAKAQPAAIHPRNESEPAAAWRESQRKETKKSAAPKSSRIGPNDSGHETLWSSPAPPMGANQVRRVSATAPATAGIAKPEERARRSGEREFDDVDHLAAATKYHAATIFTMTMPQDSTRSLTPLPTE